MKQIVIPVSALEDHETVSLRREVDASDARTGYIVLTLRNTALDLATAVALAPSLFDVSPEFDASKEIAMQRRVIAKTAALAKATETPDN